MSEDEHIYFRISEYLVEGIPDHERTKIVRKHPEQDVWAICNDGCCLAKDGEWEYEPMPSNRDDEFIARTRFTIYEAMNHVEKIYGTPKSASLVE